MKKSAIFILAFAASSAFAFSCPGAMTAIDAKLATKPALAAADMTKVMSLRSEGEKLHKEGKHAESVKRLDEAKKILGI